MISLIGIVVVFGAIVGGYLLEHGKLLVLLQPAELVIIGGAAAGTVLIANPMSTVIRMLKGLLKLLKPDEFDRHHYLETLKLLNELFSAARKRGLVDLESDIEDPAKSPLFSKHGWFLKHEGAVSFICDTLRMAITGAAAAHDLDQMMELDIEIRHRGDTEPVAALSTVADSLPGLGIVAAVLGVVITMGALGGPPEEIGHKVAAALVGTFLGILMCYGLFGPLASRMTKWNEAESQYY